MDLKAAGNLLYQVGTTKNEFGGSHFGLVNDQPGGEVPKVDTAVAKLTFHTLHKAIKNRLVRSCHDMSEGGLAVSVAEMAFAGGFGATVNLDSVPCSSDATDEMTKLFAESNSRFVCEVAPENKAAFEATMNETACQQIGTVNGTVGADNVVEFVSNGNTVLSELSDELKTAWQSPLDWS